MRRRSTLIGFTEAELGFVIAAVVAFAATGEAPVAVPPAVDSTAFAATPETLPGGLPGSISRQPLADTLSRVQLRRCSEIGLPRSPLPLISVVDTNSFIVDGDTLDLSTLNSRLAIPEAEAKERKCRYGLQLDVVGALPASQYFVAQRTFRARFYVQNPNR